MHVLPFRSLTPVATPKFTKINELFGHLFVSPPTKCVNGGMMICNLHGETVDGRGGILG